jgi:hypothetical protein
MRRKQYTAGIALGLVFLMVSFVSGQTGTYSTATLIDSIGPATDCDLRGRFDLLLAEIMNNPDSKAIVFVHGTPAQIAFRTRYYKEQATFRRFNVSRLKFITGRNIGDVRTDMWLVPSGAHEPDVKPEAWIFREVGRAYKTSVAKGMADLDEEARKLSDHQAYIVNYGTPAQIAQREKWIRDAIVFRRFDSHRITLVNGGSGPVRTVMWLVPPGAENPKP